MTSKELKYAFGLKPEQAIEYFKAKGFRITWNWHEMLESAHAKAFTVAKVMRADILQDIHGELTKALEQGQTFAEWKKNLTPRLKAKGWWGEVVNEATGEVANVGPHRLRTIYKTNIQTAYMAGHYQQMMENAADRPWGMYVAVMDKRTRPAHSALNGLTFRLDDPFWDTHWPQNGFECRCDVRALTDARLEEKIKAGEAAKRSTVGPDANATLTPVEKPLDREGKRMATVTSMKTRGLNGEKIAMAPDAGWSYNPGKAEHQLDVAAWAKARKAPAGVRQAFIDDMARTPVKDKVFASWVNEVVRINHGLIDQAGTTRLKNSIVTAGWLDDTTLTSLEKRGVTLETPFIVSSDSQIFHAMRPDKHNPVDLEELKLLPGIIRSAPLWLDPGDNSLIFVTGSGDELSKFVVKTNDPVKKFGRLNPFITAGRISAGDVKAGGWKRIR